MEWHQSSSPSTEAATPTARPAEAAAAAGERKARPQKEQALNCPRCNSADTKFCYYNNYSLSQPRYFCKTCRRYWTEGGSLRNVPVGGGSRKNKRPSSSSPAADAGAAATSGTSTIVPPSPKKLLLPGVGSDFIPSGSVLPISLSAARTTHKLMQDGVQDLNLGFPHLAVGPLPDLVATSSGAMGLLRPFMPLQELYSSSAFGLMQELIKAPPLSYQAEVASGGIRAASAGFGADLEMENSATTGRLLYPLEDVKPLVVHDPTNSTAAVAAASASASVAEFQMINGRSSQTGGPPVFWSDNIGDGSGTGEGW